MRLNTPHCTDHGKTVSRFSDIQISQKNIELLPIDQLECLHDRLNPHHFETSAIQSFG